VYTPTLKKHQVVRDLKKFENHWPSLNPSLENILMTKQGQSP